jgi:hypothetical protein
VPDGALFDQAIARDIKSGRLDCIAEEAIVGFGTGRPKVSEVQDIDRGLLDAADGNFASEGEVEATFAKHRHT